MRPLTEGTNVGPLLKSLHSVYTESEKKDVYKLEYGSPRYALCIMSNSSNCTSTSHQNDFQVMDRRLLFCTSASPSRTIDIMLKCAEEGCVAFISGSVASMTIVTDSAVGNCLNVDSRFAIQSTTMSEFMSRWCIMLTNALLNHKWVIDVVGPFVTVGRLELTLPSDVES